jgi:hypothetical protein
MKFITLLVSFIYLFSAQAFAHDDHGLGEGSFHAFYHTIFWTIFVLVVYKAVVWFNHKRSQKN